MPSSNMALPEVPGCSAPELYDSVTDYCFDHADKHTRDIVEAHLRTCLVCQHEVKRLTEAASLLQQDPTLSQPIRPADVAAVFGLSAHLHQPFGGHAKLAIISSAIYAALYVMTLWSEIGLQLNKHALQVAIGSPFIFATVFFTTRHILKYCWEKVRLGYDHALIKSALMLMGSAAVAYLLSWVSMPTEPVNGAASPQQIFLQNTIWFFMAFSFCLLIPFHFTISMQRELFEGKHNLSIQTLNREKDGVSPRGVIYMPSWFMAIFLTAACIFVMWGPFAFVKTVKPSSFRDFYVTLSLVLWITYVLACVAGFTWFKMMINELKRECLMINRFSDHESP